MKIMYCRKDFSSIDDRNYNLGQNRWKIYTPPPPPQIKDEKMALFGFFPALSLIWRGGMGVRRSILFFQDCSPLSRHNCLVFENRWGNGAENGA